MIIVFVSKTATKNLGLVTELKKRANNNMFTCPLQSLILFASSSSPYHATV